MSANLLEHVPDDRSALAEIARVLKPGRPAALVVPAGPRTFDYYDRFLGHERRYARGELADKCRAAGLEPREDRHLASLLYPAFWLVKQRNRWRYDHLRGDALEAQGHAGHRPDARLAPGRASRGSWRIGWRAPAFGSRSGSARSSWPGGCRDAHDQRRHSGLP